MSESGLQMSVAKRLHFHFEATSVKGIYSENLKPGQRILNFVKNKKQKKPTQDFGVYS